MTTPATFVSDDGLFRLGVWIVNRSASGVMIELDEYHDLPTSFTLLFKHVLEPCRLVWQSGSLAGACLVANRPD